MICGRKAIQEALVVKSVAFADRPEFYVHILTNPRVKGTSLIMAALRSAYVRNFMEVINR